MSQGPVLSENVTSDVHASVEKLFSQMFSISVRSEFQKISKEQLPADDVIGIMGLVQKVPLGTLIVGFPKTTIFNLLKNLYGKEFTEIDKSATALVGESANIIYGVLKSRLNSQGFSFGGFGIPQVLTGARPSIPKAAWIVCGKFNSEAGPFHVTIVGI